MNSPRMFKPPAGTNVLEEYAYFLDLTVQSDKPVVVTGAMHQYGTFTYDAYTNLFSSIRLAASGKSVVLVSPTQRLGGLTADHAVSHGVGVLLVGVPLRADAALQVHAGAQRRLVELGGRGMGDDARASIGQALVRGLHQQWIELAQQRHAAPRSPGGVPR